MSLDAAARSRYARQLLLAEIGEAGQLRLQRAGFRSGPDVDPDAYAVAATYLARAGCTEDSGGDSGSIDVASATVDRFAAGPSLRAPAAAVLGALAAVEHLKAALGVGEPSRVPPELTLRAPFPED